MTFWQRWHVARPSRDTIMGPEGVRYKTKGSCGTMEDVADIREDSVASYAPIFHLHQHASHCAYDGGIS